MATIHNSIMQINLFNQPISHPTIHSFSKQAISTHLPIQTIKLLTNQPTNQPTSKSINQSINQLIYQLIYQSIN